MATAKRIRCICGKIYDPSEHTAGCPACGVQVTIQRISIVAPGQQAQPVLPSAEASNSGHTPPVSPAPRANLPWVWIVGAVAFVGLVMICAAIGVAIWLWPKPVVTVVTNGKDTKKTDDTKASDDKKGGDDKKVVDKGGSGSSSSNQTGADSSKSKSKTGGATADTGGANQGSGDKSKSGADKPKTSDAVAAAFKPIFKYDGKMWKVEAKGTPEENGKALADAVEQSDEGDSIQVFEGSYVVEGLAVEFPIRIFWEDNGTTPALISSTGKKPPFRVTTKGFTLEGVIVTQNGPTMPAINIMKESEVQLLHCIFTSKSNSVMNVMVATSVTALDCAFGSMASTPKDSNNVTLMGTPGENGANLSFNFTQCDFGGGLTGVRISHAAKGEFRECKFHEIGLSDGTGSVLLVGGRDVDVTADQCQFYKNRTGISVTAGSLQVTGGNFSDNGVPGDETSKNPQPLGGAMSAGQLSFKDVTFKSNREGLVAVEGGAIKVTDCHFEDIGVETRDAAIPFVSHALVVRGMTDNGRPASITVTGSDFTRCNTRLAYVLDGTSLTMENCRATGGSMDIITIGGDGSPCSGTFKKCQFSEFSQGGMVVSMGSSATFENCEFRRNKIGFEVRDPGTKLQLQNSIFSGNELWGVIAIKGAEASGTGCTFDGSKHGIQAGMTGKPDHSGAVNLENCRFLNNTSEDVLVCTQSRAVLRNCTFADGAAPRVVRDPGGTIDADPPVQIIAGNNSQPQQGQGNGGTVPAQKPTASNNKSPSRQQQPPQPTTPSRPQTVPGKVGEVIDVIDKIKRLVR